MIKTRIFMLAILLILATVFSCSASSPSPKPTPAASPTVAPATSAPATTQKPAASPTPTSAPSAAPKAKTTVRWGMVSGGSNDIQSGVVASIMDKYSTTVKVSPVGIKGSVEATRALVTGDVEVSLASAESSADLLNGTGEWGKTFGARKDMRALLPSTMTYMIVQTFVDSPIKTFADLKGKKIAAHSKGSSVWPLTMLVLQQAGFDLQKDITIVNYDTLQAQAAALENRQVDAQIAFPGVGSMVVQEPAEMKDCKVIPLPEDLRDKVIVASKGSLSKTILPAGSYRLQNYDVPTISGGYFWLTTTKLSDDVAFEIVKQIYDHYDEAKAGNKVMEQLDIKTAAAFRGFGVAYHDGALKYFNTTGPFK